MAKQPNIILINCDDLGYGDLGCYGSQCNRTPHLDRMAAEGLRFTDFYMASPVCSPSRGAMLTGCYPPRIGFANFDGSWVLFPGQALGLDPQEETVATLLKRAGYATKCVGKWHCGDQEEFLPTRHGFDSYYGLPYSNDMGRQAGRDGGLRNPDFPPLPLLRDEEVIQEQPDQSALTERYVEECVRFIREERDGPFFLYFAHMYVHLPLFVPERFMNESENGRYGGAVASIDWSVGVLLDELARQGLDDDTIVLFTSDNGSRARGEGGSNDPLRGHKGQTWEGGMRLPLIARWPGRIAPGGTCTGLTASVDLLPTLCGLAGSDTPSREIDGVDLGPLLQDPEAESPRREFVYYFREQLEAVRDDRFKLHARKGGEEHHTLYDLRADIGETTDVADVHPVTVERLGARLDHWRHELGDSATNSPGHACRPVGRVDEGKKLTEYREDHPYIVAMYDLTDAG